MGNCSFVLETQTIIDSMILTYELTLEVKTNQTTTNEKFNTL
ncbi:MAG: hypothetical protein ACK4K5_00775 [Thermosynechococcus sp.]